MESRKERSVAIQHSLMNGGGLFPLSFFDTRRYVQHNVQIEDGIGAVLRFIDGLPPGSASVKTCRSIEDGDLTVVHNEYRLGDWGMMAAFEVHRWDGDRIVEHWDNLQSLAPAPNPSGRTMTDGETRIADPERTKANKDLVARFVDEVLIGRNLKEFDRYFRGGVLLQHNPELADGAASLREAIDRDDSRYARLHRLIGEGNFVLTVCEGSTVSEGGERTIAFYDLYRLDDGVIAEHWDVVEVVAPPETWKNSNGKF